MIAAMKQAQNLFFKSEEISSYYAKLPTYTHNRFSEMYNTVKRYIIPFECHSMYDFGFDLYDKEESKLSSDSLEKIIHNPEDALSLLKLIEQSINFDADRRIRPHELGFVLLFIKDNFSTVSTSREYRQLTVLVN